MCFFILFLLFTNVIQSEESPLEKRLEQIDEQISALELKKVALKKSALRHLDRAHQWQFSKETSLDSGREYDAVAAEEDKMASIDLQILKLKKEKGEELGR